MMVFSLQLDHHHKEWLHPPLDRQISDHISYTHGKVLFVQYLKCLNGGWQENCYRTEVKLVVSTKHISYFKTDAWPSKFQTSKDSVYGKIIGLIQTLNGVLFYNFGNTESSCVSLCCNSDLPWYVKIAAPTALCRYPLVHLDQVFSSQWCNWVAWHRPPTYFRSIFISPQY